eukprot:1146490-Pelagomonas_calceolata.AAC.8
MVKQTVPGREPPLTEVVLGSSPRGGEVVVNVFAPRMTPFLNQRLGQNFEQSSQGDQQVFVMEDEEQRTSFRNLSIHRANNEEEALNLLQDLQALCCAPCLMPGSG